MTIANHRANAVFADARTLYDDALETLEDTERRIREAAGYIADAERLAE